MWLLNIETRQLESFLGSTVPEYAILSHRWEDGEVSFQDVMNGVAQDKKGYYKIDMLCKQVRIDRLPVAYVWVDTCCIDKTNNSELSEAINSMYKWYLLAKVCYAYLSDVSTGNTVQFAGSLWFTRGWTLQELLAPSELYFVDRDWQKLGSKAKLSESLTQITGIPADALQHFDSRRCPFSVADRMSWASRRHTTREEDLAYSLLGIFGVNMPLLYGEGPRAFLRLQEEILKISEDLTIFAWQKFPRFPITNSYINDINSHDFSLFAASPASFDHIGRKYQNFLDRQSHGDETYLESTISGAGLAINLTLVPYCPRVYLAPLCFFFFHDSADRHLFSDNNEKVVAMFVERTQFKGRYRRIVYDAQALLIGHADELNIALGQRRRVVLERLPFHAMARPKRDKYGFNVLQIEPDFLHQFHSGDTHKIYTLRRSPDTNSLFMASGDVGVAGIVRFTRRGMSPIYFHFGFDFDWNPFCLISRCDRRSSGISDNPIDKILYNAAVSYEISISNNIDVLRLVSLLQSDARKLSLREDNVELHMGSWQSHEMQFVGQDCRVALEVSAGHQDGYVYHVFIGLANENYTWASDDIEHGELSPSGKEVDWYSVPLDHRRISYQSFSRLKRANARDSPSISSDRRTTIEEDERTIKLGNGHIRQFFRSFTVR